MKINNKHIKNRNLKNHLMYRQRQKKETRVHGENACKMLFNHRPQCIITAWFTKLSMSRFKEIIRWMVLNHKAYHVVDNKDITKISGTLHHEGICLLIKRRQAITVKQWINLNLSLNHCILLALDNVQNPHNIGAIVRSCAHFGIKGILLQNPSIIESGATMRTAEGGVEYIQPIKGKNLLENIKKFSQAGYSILTTSSQYRSFHKGQSLFDTKLPQKIVLIFGQESTGLSDTILAISDINIYIEGTGSIESLNVSVAVGIILNEWWRQYKKK